MPERVDARDVLDTNATTVKPFRATVVGYFRRTGPNSWDDYEFIHEDPETLEISPGIDVQLERHGTELRLRRKGTTFRVRWEPGADDPPGMATQPSNARRRYFIENYLSDFDEPPGIGVAAFVASKLR